MLETFKYVALPSGPFANLFKCWPWVEIGAATVVLGFKNGIYLQKSPSPELLGSGA